MSRLSIRWRLTLWYGLMMVVAFGSFCLLILILARHQSLVHMDESLREELTERVLEVKLAHSLPELETQMTARFFQNNVYDVRVLNELGKPVFVSAGLLGFATPFAGRNFASANTPYFETVAIVQGREYRVATVSANGDLGSFIVQAMISMETRHAEMQSLQTIMLILLPLTLAVASIGGYVMAGRVLAPVLQIVEVANSISIGNLNRRMKIVNPNDEIGRLTATLNALIARLENAVNEIQRFTADASHELRTPLAALRSEAESALCAQRSPEEYVQTLTIVVDEATRLARLTDQLLNLSRLDAGISGSEKQCVRMDALILDVIEQLRPLSVQQSVTIVVSKLQPCEIEGDDIRLSQALFNILENALKYTQASGRVDIRCHCVNRTAVIEVEDTGIGISDTHLPRVFDRFFRVDPSRNCVVGGTGLGLSIAQSAILAHQGTIDIRSQHGTGTTVTISIANATPVEDDLPLV